MNYTGAFDDASKGKIAANAMYSSGVDIIFHAAGATGNGVFSEAKERKAKDANANIWVIGVDADQYAEGEVDASTNVTLTSMLKGVNNAVVDIATRTQNGEFPGEVIERNRSAFDLILLQAHQDRRKHITRRILDENLSIKLRITENIPAGCLLIGDILSVVKNTYRTPHECDCIIIGIDFRIDTPDHIPYIR